MKEFFYVIILIILILAELTLASHLTFGGVRPNLILVGMLAWFILRGVKETLRSVSIGGIILDIFSPLPFGVISLSLLATLFLVWLLSLRVLRLRERNIEAIILITVVGSAVYNVLLILGTKFFVLLYLANIAVDLVYSLKYLLFPIVVYNLLVMFFIYKILKYCHSRLYPVK